MIELREIKAEQRWRWLSGGLVGLMAIAHPIALGLGSAITLSIKAVYQELHRTARVLGSFGLLPKTTFIIFLIILTLANSATPASAQFFSSAQTWMESSFEVDQQLTELTFNVLRALFIIYIAISLIRVVYSVRQDEDWQSTARTPLIVVVTITIADVLTQVITGEGGGGA